MGKPRMRAGVALGLASALVVTTGAVVAAQSPDASGTPAGVTEIAYLSASSANTWLGRSKEAMDEVAAANGIKLTEFDGQFNPDLQTTQLQDVITSGKYKGIIVAALNGVALIPDLQKAAAAGMKIVGLNQVIGTRLDTADPQDPSISASVMNPPLRSGERLGKITLQACEGLDPCRVVYFYGVKGLPIDVALRQGFDAVVAENPAVQVVAEAEGQYLGPDVALAAMQDVLVSTPDFDVVVGSDQAMGGVELALEDAGKLDKVKIIGLGGSAPALQAVRDGRWFGDEMGVPATEGRLAMEAMIKALAGEDVGGIDSVATLPDEGLVTRDNIDEFTAEWNG